MPSVVSRILCGTGAGLSIVLGATTPAWPQQNPAPSTTGSPVDTNLPALSLPAEEVELDWVAYIWHRRHQDFDQKPATRSITQVRVENPADLESLVFKVEGLPDKEDYEFCYKPSICGPVEIDVESSSGLLYFVLDREVESRVSSKIKLYHYVNSFPPQRVELSVADTASSLKV